MLKLKPLRKRGKELLNMSIHGSSRKCDSRVKKSDDDGSSDEFRVSPASPSRRRRNSVSEIVHGAKASPLARGRSLLNSSLHGSMRREVEDPLLGEGSFDRYNESALRNSFHGVMRSLSASSRHGSDGDGLSDGPRNSTSSSSGKGLKDSLHGTLNAGKDFLSNSFHGVSSRMRTHPVSSSAPASSYAMGNLHDSSGNKKNGCMKVATIEESLRSCRALNTRSPRDDIAFLLKSYEEDDMLSARPSPQKNAKSRRTISGVDVAKKTYPVRFAVVTVREYKTCLGDNPSSVDGLPLAIDWKYTEFGGMKVNEYESHRADPRPKEAELRMNYFDRYEILRRAGYSSDEIERATKKNKKALKEHRGKSFLGLGSKSR